jgi:hypothetical protein
MAQESGLGCEATTLRVAVHNLGSDGARGYVAGDARSSFELAPKGTTQISISVPANAAERRVQVFLPEEASFEAVEDIDAKGTNQCEGIVELPSRCPAKGDSAHLYLYKTARGPQCFMRSVAHHPRPRGAALALKR